jgi:hypothetical protein
VPLGAVTGMTCTLGRGMGELKAAGSLYYSTAQNKLHVLALISRVAVYKCFTSRSGKFVAKENLVDTDEADNPNVYPVFIFPGNIKTVHFLAGVLLKVCDAASLD